MTINKSLAHDERSPLYTVEPKCMVVMVFAKLAKRR
jgi:hypothetical protein